MRKYVKWNGNLYTLINTKRSFREGDTYMRGIVFRIEEINNTASVIWLHYRTIGYRQFIAMRP